MDKNIFIPFRGISASIFFGDTREDIRKTLGRDFIEVKRNEFAVNSSDYYEIFGFFVEFSSDNLCEAIEFTDLGSLFYNSEDLIKIDYSILRNNFDKHSLNIEEEIGIGVTYHDLGFSVTKKKDKDNIETILIFSKTYW
ncbi:MAG: hypothetical protein COB98_09905 [Flavobacteriaceae bacterium]|nr:MAG: hypothetical protein COB98_09905 [Flavobacteriaceae bacterium]